ncbi:MAG: c-type cytochrome [Gemmatimonadaceae bacterium]|nr:c-type cytochrome [Chitinophagaceae bacterium]
MKKFFVITMIAAACYACGNNAEKAGAEKEPEKKDAAAAADPSKNPDYEKGLTLIGESDCLTCHKIDEAATGPAYRDVANKYPNTEATLDTLAKKIIVGGKGNWGPVPMTPHPTMSVEDAKQIVKYIMLLKTN